MVLDMVVPESRSYLSMVLEDPSFPSQPDFVPASRLVPASITTRLGLVSKKALAPRG